MQQYDCVIIDSGVNLDHPLLKGQNIHGLSITASDVLETNDIKYNDEFFDYLGHGTAIYTIIQRNTPSNTKILNINIFGKENSINEEILIGALHYVYENIRCKVINISSGLTACSNIPQLYSICKMLTDTGAIIVSAFDNAGAISYPAAFDCVIGVDASDNCNRIDEYEYVEDSPITIRAKGGFQKVAWYDPEYAIVKGSSFSCAYVSARIIELLLMNNSWGKHEILEFFSRTAKCVYTNSPFTNTPNDYFEPERALIFHVNKEIYSLIAFNSYLNFSICAITDLRSSGNVNRHIRDLITYRDLGALNDFSVENFENIDWGSDFDTIIVGHVKPLSQIVKRDLLSEILRLCIDNHKNVICLDDLTPYSDLLKQLYDTGCKVYYPKISKRDLPINHFGKLYFNNTPTICIAGTSSNQGKFTLQLLLREQLLKMGYKIGQLGTEPTSRMLGLDEVYNYGYSVENNYNFERTVQYVNKLIQRIVEKEPDLIITGIQSGIVPYAFSNLAFLTNRHLEVLTGILPDAIVLCINPNDDVTLIKRAIATVENYIQATVLCCALFPLKYSEQFQIYGKREMLNAIEQDTLISELENKIGLKVFPMNSIGVSKIASLIVEYFSE